MNTFVYRYVIFSATFMGEETLVSSSSVNVENTFYLLWYV